VFPFETRFEFGGVLGRGALQAQGGGQGGVQGRRGREGALRTADDFIRKMRGVN